MASWPINQVRKKRMGFTEDLSNLEKAGHSDLGTENVVPRTGLMLSNKVSIMASSALREQASEVGLASIKGINNAGALN